MSSPLLVAAGGGGDVISAAVLGRRLSPSTTPIVMSFAWERLIVDPLPGPRAIADFTGLRQLDDDLFEVLPTSEAVPPAASLLPRLARELDARIMLLDPSEGVLGLTRQIRAARRIFGANDVLVVDVGGDIAAHGDEPELLSPLADSAGLAAASAADPGAQVVVLGAGLDGELDPQTVLARLEQAGTQVDPRACKLNFEAVTSVFDWHPSEASGLLAAASRGIRGRVEIRDGGLGVRLTPGATTAYITAAAHLTRINAIAGRLSETSSLAEIEQVVLHTRGASEIDYERRKASGQFGRRDARLPDDLLNVDEYAASAAKRKFDFVTTRRLAETHQIHHQSLTRILAQCRPSRLSAPLYATKP